MRFIKKYVPSENRSNYVGGNTVINGGSSSSSNVTVQADVDDIRKDLGKKDDDQTKDTAFGKIWQMRLDVINLGEEIGGINETFDFIDSQIAAINEKDTAQDSSINLHSEQIKTMVANDIERDKRVDAVETTVGGYDQRITDAETAANNATTQVSQMQTQLTANGQRITELETNDANQDTLISGLRTDLGTKGSTDENNAFGRIAALSNRIGDAETDITAINEKDTAQDQSLNLHSEQIKTIVAKNIEQTEAITNLQTSVGTVDDVASATGSLYARDKATNARIDHHTEQIKTMVNNDLARDKRVDALETTVGEYDTRITDAETIANNATTQVSQMQTQVTGNGQRITALETTVGGFDTRITDAENKANNATDSVVSLSDSVSEIRGIANNNTTQISQLSTTVGGYDQRITDAETTANDAKTAANNATTQVSQMQTQVTGNGNRITALETNDSKQDQSLNTHSEQIKTIVDKNIERDKRVDAVETSITTIQNDFTALDTEVGNHTEELDNINWQIEDIQKNIPHYNIKINRYGGIAQPYEITNPSSDPNLFKDNSDSCFLNLNKEMYIVIENYDEDMSLHPDKYRIVPMFFKRKTKSNTNNNFHMNRRWRVPMFNKAFNGVKNTAGQPIVQPCRFASIEETYYPITSGENLIWGDNTHKTIAYVCGLYPKTTKVWKETSNPDGTTSRVLVDSKTGCINPLSHTFTTTNNRKMKVGFAVYKKLEKYNQQGELVNIAGEYGWSRVSNIASFTLFCDKNNVVRFEAD